MRLTYGSGSSPCEMTMWSTGPGATSATRFEETGYMCGRYVRTSDKQRISDWHRTISSPCLWETVEPRARIIREPEANVPFSSLPVAFVPGFRGLTD